MMWRKRQTRAKLAPNVYHNEQNPSDLVNILTNSSIKSEQKHDILTYPLDILHDLSIKSDDLSIKSKKIEEDDDIQVYKKPWVGLTEEDIKLFDLGNYIYVVRIVEARLKELNA